jgi:hypothetical protein
MPIVAIQSNAINHKDPSDARHKKRAFLSLLTSYVQRWSRIFGPFVKVNRMMKEVIQDEKPKEPFA